MTTPVDLQDIVPGATFSPNQFSDPYFLPEGKYESLSVDQLGDDDVRVYYKGRNQLDDRYETMALEELHKMLGLEPIGKGLLEESDVDKLVDQIDTEDDMSTEDMPEFMGSIVGVDIFSFDKSASKESIYFGAAKAPVGKQVGEFEVTGSYKIKTRPNSGIIAEIHYNPKGW